MFDVDRHRKGIICYIETVRGRILQLRKQKEHRTKQKELKEKQKKEYALKRKQQETMAKING